MRRSEEREGDEVVGDAGISRVLQPAEQVGLDYMRMKGDLVRVIGEGGLVVASWAMEDLVAAGEVGVSKMFGEASRKIN